MLFPLSVNSVSVIGLKGRGILTRPRRLDGWNHLTCTSSFVDLIYKN